jgi:pimeloyl-ACP methyl ester carboxylesterase
MYVLVHGAGMGASCWDRLIPHLDAPAVAIDLPGRGSRSNVPIESVTLEDCADALRETLRDVESDDIVMVAHSFAGVTVPRVMAEFAPRLRHVAFLSAVVPPDGTSVLDQIDPSVREAVRASITGGIYSQERQGAQMMLCNDLDPEATEWTLDQVVDDSAALLTETVDLAGLTADVPRTYIRLTKDACYPPELQERSVSIVGGDVAYLNTGHMAMVAAPERLAQTLRELR